MAKLGAFVGGLLMGGLAGAALGVLTAPKPGSRLREDLVDKSDELYRKAKYEIEELADRYQVERKIDEAKEALHQSIDTQVHSRKIIDRSEPQSQF